MNTVQIEYFITLAETLNYTKASDQLGIAQPTLSKAIKHLETECGFPLIMKKGRNIDLTPQGKQILPYFENMISNLEKGLDSVTFGRESLRLGVVMALSEDLPEIIEKIHDVSDSTYVKIVNGVSSELIRKLLDHELDLIFCTPSDQYDQLIFKEYSEQRLYLCVYPSHPLASQKEAVIENLDGEDVVSHTRGGYLNNLYNKMMEDRNIHVHIVAEADEDRHVAALVRKGLGITIISTNNPDQYNGVVLVPLKHKNFRRTIAAAWHKDDQSVLPFIESLMKKRR